MTVVSEIKPAAADTAVSTIRDILVQVDSTPNVTPRLHAAVDLARRFGATVTGAGLEMLKDISDPQGMLAGSWAVELQKIVDENLNQAEAAFRAKTAGLPTRWIRAETFPAPALARLARGADLIVAGGAVRPEHDPYRSADTAELVMTSGRPVLVAPPIAARFRGEAVVVAWKDTRESRRALADSLPFLKIAEDVVVVEVCDNAEVEDADARTQDVTNHLRRHGVQARHKVVAARPAEVFTELRAVARGIDADLIVAGAYGHSRLGEWVFGGVTYDLLNSPEHFVLLSH